MPSGLPIRRQPNGAATNAGGNEFATGFSRIAQALGFETQLELAEILSIRQSSISDAKRRGVIPGEWALKLFRQYRLNPRWVYDGLPPMFLGSSTPLGDPGQSGGRSFLLKYPEGAIVALLMTDSAMEPSIPRGSLVGVNTQDKSFEDDTLVAIDLPLEGLSIRRLCNHETQGMVRIKAENSGIPMQHVPDQFVNERLAGRVVWIMSQP